MWKWQLTMCDFHEILEMFNLRYFIVYCDSIANSYWNRGKKIVYCFSDTNGNSNSIVIKYCLLLLIDTISMSSMLKLVEEKLFAQESKSIHLSEKYKRKTSGIWINKTTSTITLILTTQQQKSNNANWKKSKNEIKTEFEYGYY